MINSLMSPLGERQPFIWIAEYNDGTDLKEFEDTGKENLFSDIDKNRVERFNIVGRSVRLYFDTDTGVFDITGKKTSFSILEDNGNIIQLTEISDKKYNDIISFKMFYRDYASSTRRLTKPIIGGYFFGYKTDIVNNDRNIHFKAIYAIPIGKTMRFGFKLSPDKDLKGKFVIKSGNKTEYIDINVAQNQSIDFEWLYIM